MYAICYMLAIDIGFWFGEHATPCEKLAPCPW